MKGIKARNVKAMDKAYITVITGEQYFLGLKVLVWSLKRTKTTIPIYALVPVQMDSKLKQRIRKLGINIIEKCPIEITGLQKEENLSQNWNETFFKLHIANLTQFKKIIYLDADMLILKNIDHLFEYPSLSATVSGKAVHPEWKEFNSGIMVLEPNNIIFENLLRCIDSAIERKQKMKFGYGDQDVFNEYYSDWKTMKNHHFSEKYNALTCFLDVLMKKEGWHSFKEIYILHYIGEKKIWNNTIFSNMCLLYNCLVEKRYKEGEAYILYLYYLIKCQVFPLHIL